MTSRRWKRRADISLCLLIRAGALELNDRWGRTNPLTV